MVCRTCGGGKKDKLTQQIKELTSKTKLDEFFAANKVKSGVILITKNGFPILARTDDERIGRLEVHSYVLQ